MARSGTDTVEVPGEDAESKAGRTGVVEGRGTTSGLAKAAQSGYPALGLG